MAITKPLNGICWIRRQRCPCGERKCYIRCGEGKGKETSSSEVAIVEDDNVVAPYVGQTFETDDEAFEYYSNFARKNGFAIRRESSRSNDERGVYLRVFACHRYGPERNRRKLGEGERKREKKTLTACGCEARMYILKKVQESFVRWTIRQFHNEHNHELLEDDQVRFLPAYRKIPDGDRERILSLYKAGCSVRHILKVLLLEKGGGASQLPFIDRDVRNFLQSYKKVDREIDAGELLNVCKIVKERDVDFSYDYTIEENSKLENIAWTYVDSKRAYRTFGDVVGFDVTYREMTYDRVLGVWFGKDNNGETVFFGCVLLRDETSQSFAWALKVFLRFMQGRSPQTILTDIDLGLQDAIASVLPNTKHVICAWHIVSKLSSWLSFPLGAQFEEFKGEFDRLYNLENKRDFDAQWNQMITRFALGSNKHASILFAHRASWAQPYIRGHFLAKMMSDQYSKSIDAFLKRILTSQTCLESFFEQVSAVASNKNEAGEEKIEDIQIKTAMPVEEHASGILTHYAFNLLQHEIVLSMQCAAVETSHGSYTVHHHKKMDSKGSVVNWFPKDEKIYCSCKEFEASGILCRHALRVLALKNYFQLPLKYLPVRWRQESSLVQCSDDNWSQAFQSLTSALYAESIGAKERIDYVHRELTRILNHVSTMATDDGISLNLEYRPQMDASMDDVANDNECHSTWNSVTLG
ncbi:hypothetical protein GIB67_001019 [Kingdonia uniflora]|uniref:Protein FAR1-RELATED SEQUENCE n=1 Tax=Kingdonia uniflora TaxID=39325 RepID=A0A7J7MFX6_9MAGN|nr:hypothetical protein GIB67_001019 [Kingdonia uniflora]